MGIFRTNLQKGIKISRTQCFEGGASPLVV